MLLYLWILVDIKHKILRNIAYFLSWGQFFSSELLKISSIILSIILKLFGENKIVKSSSLLSFNIKSINPMQKYQHIIKSQFCILWYFCWLWFFNFFWNIFNSKTIKICHIIIFHIQNCPMSSLNWTHENIYVPSFILSTFFLE